MSPSIRQIKQINPPTVVIPFAPTARAQARPAMRPFCTTGQPPGHVWPGALVRFDFRGNTVRAVLCDLEISACDPHRQDLVIAALSRAAVALTPHPSFIVDLQHVRRLSGAMLGALVQLAGRVRSCGGAFALAHVAGAVQQEIRVCRLQKVLPMTPDTRVASRPPLLSRAGCP